MRFGFVTAVQLGLGCLEEIYDVGGSVDFLMTLRDDIAPKKSGRVSLDEFAAEHGAPLHKVRSVNDPDSVEFIIEAALDWLIIVGWSQVAGLDVLAATTYGCLGMHPTLLPKGRGRASIPWAILKGLDETGVTMFKLDEGVDTGPILTQERVPMGSDETATTLYGKIAAAHRTLMRDTFPRLETGGIQTIPQDDSKATVWPGRVPADGELQSNMTVADIDRLVRATTHPYPGAFTTLPDGSKVSVWAGSPNPTSNPALTIGAIDGTYWATEVSVDQ